MKKYAFVFSWVSDGKIKEQWLTIGKEMPYANEVEMNLEDVNYNDVKAAMDKMLLPGNKPSIIVVTKTGNLVVYAHVLSQSNL